MSALGVLLCAACDVELHEMCGGGCTCGCHERITPESAPRFTVARSAAPPLAA